MIFFAILYGMPFPISPGSLVQVVSSFDGRPIKGCPVAVIVANEWKKISVLEEYYEGWTYTILWNGRLERHISHEWILEIQESPIEQLPILLQE